MRLLILGGTKFVGKHIVLEALAAGHQVSIFTRGQQPDDLPGEVHRLRGDRDGQLEALEQGAWDAVIDVSGYIPRVVRASAQALQDRTSRYLFISTVSVYAEPDQQHEDGPLATLQDPHEEQVTGETYGGLKVLCEQAVQEVYGERATVVRPGLIVGPFDPSDRFTFWIHHLAQGEVWPVFGQADTAMQVIDARDLASFVIHLLERDVKSTFNAVGEQSTWGSVIEAVEAEQGHPVNVRYLDDSTLAAHGLSLPLAGSGWARTMRTPDDRAVQAGLVRRPLQDTVRDTLAWVRETNRHVNDFGFSPERQTAVLNS